MQGATYPPVTYGYAIFDMDDDEGAITDRAEQIGELQEAGVTAGSLYIDSADLPYRPTLEYVIDLCSHGDTVVVPSLDHLADSQQQVAEIMKRLADNGIRLISLYEGLDTSKTLKDMFVRFKDAPELVDALKHWDAEA